MATQPLTPHRQRHGRTRLAPVAAIGLVGVLAACGGGGSSSTAAGSSSAPSSSGVGSSGSGTAQAAPGTSGTVAAVTGSSAQVQNPTDGQVTVDWTSSTRFTKTATATKAAVLAGSCVTVTSTSAASSTGPAVSLTASSVTVTPARSGSCTAGGFGGGRGFRAGGGTGTPGSANPSRAPRTGGRAFGKVASVSADGFVVQGRTGGRTAAGGTAGNVEIAVTVTPSTTYTSTSTAAASAVVVGACLTAIGPSSSTGAVTARTIALRSKGPNGCTTGRGFGGGGFGGGAGAGGGNNA